MKPHVCARRKRGCVAHLVALDLGLTVMYDLVDFPGDIAGAPFPSAQLANLSLRRISTAVTTTTVCRLRTKHLVLPSEVRSLLSLLGISIYDFLPGTISIPTVNHLHPFPTFLELRSSRPCCRWTCMSTWSYSCPGIMLPSVGCTMSQCSWWSSAHRT